MGRPRSSTLETAMAVLLQNQAAFVSQMARTEETIASFRLEFEEIKRILRRHEQILSDLTEAIRQKIGFRPPR